MPKRRTVNFIWTGIVIAIIAATALPAMHRAGRGHTGDFTHFWQAAHAMLAGENIYTAGDGRYVYPPLLAFLLQPLALMPERAAAISWIVVNSIFVVAALLLATSEIIRRWRIQNISSPLLSIAAAAMILSIDKIRSLLNLGQSDGLMLLAFTCALRWTERRPLLAGLAVGFSANIKYLTLIFLPYFLIKRSFRAATAALLSFALFMFLPAVEVGFQRSLEYARVSIVGLGKMFGLDSATAAADIFGVDWNRSVSITSTIFRLTRSHAWPDAVALVCVSLLFAVIVAAVIGLGRSRNVAILQRRSDDRASAAVGTLEWAMLIVLSLTFSPQTTSRHMVLLTLVYVVAIAVLLSQKEKHPRFIMSTAIALMVGALTLPFGRSTSHAVWTWREIGGASWCALIFLLVLVWLGARTLSMKSNTDVAGRTPRW